VRDADMHSIKLTHTDLKPENILLVDSSADPLEVTAVTGTVCGQGVRGVSSGGFNFFLAFLCLCKRARCMYCKS
jgi:serine/threonine protein kinase